ncbi:hypothetical protein AWC22_23535 [Mycobacterium riyadhense]|uniref:Antitoxin VapB39 n=1 Tax=Mycobacterium riyadhense TaxID=486698 RepID=A0A1X2CEU5_9MYCO|nr:hypothetical protein AWC22_23535 [Mycobacterium riyadhense]
MRTTLDMDDDVVAAARELAAGERRSVGAVISELARRGLVTSSCPTTCHSSTRMFRRSSVTAK